MSYESPYGKPAGLRKRVADWHYRLRSSAGNVPAIGHVQAGAFWGGLVADLGVIMQILNLREFGEWLRANGPAEHRQFADELLRQDETIEALDSAMTRAGLTNFDPVAGVETLQRERDAERQQIAAVRQLLVEQGMLAAGDTTTPLAPLLRALLS